METTALIAISTPLDGLNFYSEMFELKGADGKPLFNTLRVGLSCQKCQDEGKAESCSHMKDVIPPWKSAAKFDMVAAIYGDRKDLLARESYVYFNPYSTYNTQYLTFSTVWDKLQTMPRLYSLKNWSMSSWHVQCGS